MADERFRRLEEIRRRVLEVPPDQRDALLDELCADDPDLRADVAAIIAHEAAVSEEFLRTPVVEAPGTTMSQWLGGGAAPRPAHPERIDEYRILRVLGEGGMGIVYLAEQDAPMRRLVALKVTKGTAGSQDVLDRFEAERQALAMMDHAGVARIYGAGTSEDGRPYFVMEYVHGEPIMAYVRRRHLEIGDRLDLFTHVCEAVQHAHQKGVVHRDLKPSNILVTEQDDQPIPKVIDFGIAKAIGRPLVERGTITQIGQFMGTPAYMSPEQARGGGDIDTRSDIYALGVLLYELLTGTPPFEQDVLRRKALVEIQRIICEVDPEKPSTRLMNLVDRGVTPVSLLLGDDPTTVRTLVRRIRGDLDWIVMKAIEKDRDRRYPSATEFAADVRRHLHDQPVVAGPPDLGYRMRKFFDRHRAAVVVSALFAILLVGATVATTTLAIRATRAEEREALRASEARLASYLARIAAAASAIEAVDPAAARAHLERARGEHQGWEWWYLWGRLDDSATIVSCGKDVSAVATSPDAAHVAAVVFNELEIRSASSFKVERRLTLGQRLRASRLVFAAPDGAADRLVVTWGDVFRVIDGPGWDERDPVKVDGGEILALAVSADGRTAATGATDGSIRTWDLDTLRPLRSFPAAGAAIVGLQLDGDTLRSVDRAGAVLETDVATGDVRDVAPIGRTVSATFATVGDTWRLAQIGTGPSVRVYEESTLFRDLDGHTAAVVSARFDASGRRLLTCSRDRTARVWSLDDDTMPATLRGHENTVLAGTFDPHRPAFITGGRDGTLRVWSDEHLARRYERQLAPLTGQFVTAVRYDDRTGTIVASTAERTRTLAPETGEMITEYVVAGGTIGLSASDRQIAIGDRSAGGVTQWDPQTGATSLRVDHGSGVQAIAFAPDQSWMLTKGLRTVKFWDPATETLLGEVSTEDWGPLVPTASIAVSPDGQTIAIGSAGAVRLVDPVTGALQAELPTVDGAIVLRVAFSDDGRHLIAGGQNGGLGGLWLWEVAGRKLVAARLDLESAVTAVASLPVPSDATVESFGRPRIMTAAGDGSAMVWTYELDEPRLVLRVPVLSMDASSDGRTVVIGGSGGTVRLLEASGPTR